MKKRESHPASNLSPLRRFRAELGLSAPGYIESWGRGIERIRQECVGHGIEPPGYGVGMAGLMLTFQANPEHIAKAGGAAASAPTDRMGAPGKTLGKTPLDAAPASRRRSSSRGCAATCTAMVGNVRFGMTAT